MRIETYKFGNSMSFQNDSPINSNSNSHQTISPVKFDRQNMSPFTKHENESTIEKIERLHTASIYQSNA